MTMAPSSCAGVVAKAPLKEPTGVRAALAITIAFEADISISQNGAGQAFRRAFDMVLDPS